MDPSEFSLYGERMTDAMCDRIREYLNDRQINDEFLEAIVCNDLSAACARADEHNKRLLHVYISFFYNYTPSPCWGSVEKVRAWLANADPVSG